MPPWFSPLFFLFARSSEGQLRRYILFLKAELEMTRARVPQSRFFLKDEERQRLLELGDGIGLRRIEAGVYRSPPNLPPLAGAEKPGEAAREEDGPQRHLRDDSADRRPSRQAEPVGIPSDRW